MSSVMILQLCPALSPAQTNVCNGGKPITNEVYTLDQFITHRKIFRPTLFQFKKRWDEGEILTKLWLLLNIKIEFFSYIHRNSKLNDNELIGPPKSCFVVLHRPRHCFAILKKKKLLLTLYKRIPIHFFSSKLKFILNTSKQFSTLLNWFKELLKWFISKIAP